MQLKVVATNVNVLQFFLHFIIFILKAIPPWISSGYPSMKRIVKSTEAIIIKMPILES